ncbi:MAG: flagellar basal body P-ring formation chaperone FlgA [Plesiomonas sp.]|uniref:flagellar basal body P-ring formation chaperone FlgA n=1 Tax=Plesiomonas sp. TaxID=2486279 RepID=UPI003F344129
MSAISRYTRFVFTLLLCNTPTWAAAVTPAEQVTQFIQQDVRSFAKAQKSQQFDVKLRNLPDFPACTNQPRIQRLSEDPPAGRVSYEVRCSTPKTWRMHVKADVSIFLPLIFASRNLTRGQVLSAGDLSTKATDIAFLRQAYFTDPKALIGQTLRRNLPAGRLINRNMLTEPDLIKRGDEVVITAQKEGVNASMKGIALEGGSRGKKIRIQNSISGKEIRARVSAHGQVMTDF